MWQPQGFYSQYVLRTPLVLTGAEAIRELYDYPAMKIAVIHGSSFHDQILFQETFAKKSVRFLLRSWHSEPDLAAVGETLRELTDFKPDTIIAVGGGSVIDGAKLCRLFYEYPYYQPGSSRLYGADMRTKFITVPTTVGSGAEVSSAAVFIDKTSGKKDMIVLSEFLPEVIVYDSRYVENAPVGLWCASAMDAVAHILEGYVSQRENNFLAAVGEKGFSLIVDEFAKLKSSEANVDYTKLQQAGFIGGIVQNHCIAGAAHAVAHQLASYGYSHGEAVALLLPWVIELNAKDAATGRKYQRIAMCGGLSDYLELTALLRKVCHIAGLDSKLKVLASLLKSLCDKADFLQQVQGDRAGKGNPIEITPDYVLALVRSICDEIPN